MSNVTVTILQNGRCDDYGIPLVAGSSYPLDYDRAKSLWQAGFASVTDPNVFDDDNTPSAGGFLRYIRFPGFKKCMLASLVANSTASRSNGLVTITATAHGITTGATYQGFRFFYPGSASLAAGWYDSIVSIPDVNTLTFSAPGADFGSQSINAAAAYTTLTTICSAILPAGTLRPYSRLTSNVFRTGDTTATTKNLRNVVGGSQLGLSTAASNPHGTHRVSLTVDDAGKTYSTSSQDQVLSNTLPIGTLDSNVEQTFLLQGSISAAAGFLTLISAFLEVEY